MPLFKNITNKPIHAVILGSRRSIKPGQIFDGPESLGAIPGLSLVDNGKKIIIPNQTPMIERVITSEIKEMTIEPFNPDVITDYSPQINKEIEYLEHMKSLGCNPDVTIAILTKNFFNLISDCCESIFKMVKYQNITLLIADTGTTDQQVLKYYETLPKKCLDKGWKYKLVNLPEYNFGNNYNAVIKNNITTEYVLIQNNDTIALNDYVSEMMNVAIHRFVGSTGCRMFYRDGRIQHDGQFFYTGVGRSFNGAGHVHLGQKKESIPTQQSNIHLVDGNTAAGVLMRRQEFLDIGGFDNGYKDIFQDVDLMMKVSPLLNKYNYCNRQANIIHYDNSSRLHTGHDPRRRQHMIDDSNYLRARIMDNSWHRAKDPQKVEFSIITLVHDLDNYKDFCNSLRQQNGKFSIELIAIPNFYNIFTSAYKALNVAQDLSNGRILIFCHDDIVVTKDWLYKINKHIVELETQNTQWGVLGSAGIFLNNNNSAYYLLDENGQPLWKENPGIVHDASRYEVASLDELCLITKKSNNLRFNDIQLNGFHFYGGNICLEAQIKGLKNFAIDAYCHHKSDGNKNVMSAVGYSEYEKCSKDFSIWAKMRGIYTWRTTTAISQQGNITLFIKPPKVEKHS